MLSGKVIRVARPTDRLAEVVRFYTNGLGLQIIDRFEHHEGFSGVMVGIPGESYHLEFTHQQGHLVGCAPTQDNLIVFYIPDRQEWEYAVDRLKAIGSEPVKSYNPYWDVSGLTFEDPDRYRIVLQNTSWET
ncbi:VOC family protein [Chamaesiphon sp. GL140_3_metabinner_50]|uniref:VOC family protein n=1 Tax=Chamaesiphon sp. GL140_3_metabinner_50 TaxID=2970812 RepID=UPI0025D9794C|nr:VOC family protein [Chamaesiphon sp. GL140_3_metabinner_50]